MGLPEKSGAFEIPTRGSVVRNSDLELTFDSEVHVPNSYNQARTATRSGGVRNAHVALWFGQFLGLIFGQSLGLTPLYTTKFRGGDFDGQHMKLVVCRAMKGQVGLSRKFNTLEAQGWNPPAPPAAGSFGVDEPR